jgi:AraC-like DNA-binding protein
MTVIDAQTSNGDRLLASLLQGVEVRSVVQCAATLRSDWALEFLEGDAWVFHVVRGQRCFLTHGDHTEPLALEDGHVVMIAAGHRHRVSSDPDVAPLWTGRVDSDASAQCHRLCVGDAEPATQLICGGFRFSEPADPFLRRLPATIVVQSTTASVPSLMAYCDLLVDEAGANRPGADLVLRRLADALFVNIIRCWMTATAAPLEQHGWIAAARDPRLTAALLAIHDEPSAPWTLDSLARLVGWSRSSFADHFTTALGCPPGRYLAELRMRLAAAALGSGRQGVAEVARAHGYRSDAAFSRTFKRVVGVPPSAILRAPR